MKVLSTFLLVSLVVSLCVISSCGREFTAPSAPDGRPNHLASTDLGEVTVEFTGIDQIRVTHKSGTDFSHAMVSAVGLGTRTPEYQELALARGVYDPGTGLTHIVFDLSAQLDSRRTSTPITVRYYLTAGAYMDVEQDVSQLWTPYGQAAILMRPASPIPSGYHPQDIDRVGSTLFFHPAGALGTYAYDIPTAKTSRVALYPGGDCIAAESSFVFCDMASQIVRLNSTTGASEKVLAVCPPGSPDASRVNGMDVYNGRLYVLHMGWLKTMNLDLVVLDSIAYSRETIRMTIEDDILYSVQWESDPDEITRFDLRTRQFLPNIPSPARELGGIRAYKGKFYYGDYQKGFVGALPIYNVPGRGLLID